MAAEVRPVTGDVLVVLAGTNDVLGNIPFEESAANLRTVVETVRTPRVIVSSIPPLDHDPGGAVAYNQQLQRLAAESGWEWVDAAAGLRDGDEYIATLTEDGIHPSAEGAQLIGEAIAAQVQAGAEQPAA
jgi:lysophospholipase L1-like esterase